MDVLQSLLSAFALILQPGVLMYVFFGVLMGIALGILPGLGGIAGMSILIVVLTQFQAEPLAGIAMAVTNLMFSWMAWTSEPTLLLFAAAVLVDDVTASIATVIFVTYISLLVDRTYTATQYALLASLGTAGRTVLASSSGAMVDGLDGDWGLFFVITALMVIPSLVVLWLVKDKFTFLEKESKSSE